MFTQVLNDAKGFVREHKSVIYFAVIALVLDHFMFKDAFRTRLHAIVEKMVAKVEAKIEEVK